MIPKALQGFPLRRVEAVRRGHSDGQAEWNVMAMPMRLNSSSSIATACSSIASRLSLDCSGPRLLRNAAGRYAMSEAEAHDRFLGKQPEKHVGNPAWRIWPGDRRSLFWNQMRKVLYERFRAGIAADRWHCRRRWTGSIIARLRGLVEPAGTHPPVAFRDRVSSTGSNRNIFSASDGLARQAGAGSLSSMPQRVDGCRRRRENCVVVEDSPAGIEAAKSAGMRVVRLSPAAPMRGHAAPSVRPCCLLSKPDVLV